MLYFFSGTDSTKTRTALDKVLEKNSKGATVVRITDAHSLADMHASLGGSGLFNEKKVYVFDNVLLNDEMRAYFLEHISSILKSEDMYLMIEGALDAATRKQVEKYSETFERFDEKKIAKQETIFALANALQSGKKKDLWVGYQKELYAGKVPEAIHGVLFWAAKQMLLRNDSPRARALVAELAELPHEARRQGTDLEYALEHFVLSRT